MRTHDECFTVDNELRERLRNKYRAFKTDVIELRSGSHKIQIQLRIGEEYLKISENTLKELFDKLCTVFLGTCRKYHVPLRQSDILILADEDVDRGLQIELKSDKKGSLLGLIFIPTFDLYAPHVFWKYTFLHELGHCWINVTCEDLDTEEIFTDLVAILALKGIVNPHSRLFKETIKLRSYTGGQQGTEYFGKDTQRDVLTNPDLYVTKLLTRVMEIQQRKSGAMQTRDGTDVRK